MEEPELVSLSSEFLFGADGVILKIEPKDDYPFRGAFFYGGGNYAVLGRNDRQFYLLKSIPPVLRQKILQSQTIMVVECSGEEIKHAYKVDVFKTDEIPLEDTFIADYQKYFSKLEEKYGKQRVNKFKQSAIEMWQKLTSKF